MHVGLLGCLQLFLQVFEARRHRFPWQLYRSSSPPAVHAVSVSPCPRPRWLVSVLAVAVPAGVRWGPVVWICVSLTASDAEHLFTCVSSLEKYLFQSFARCEVGCLSVVAELQEFFACSGHEPHTRYRICKYLPCSVRSFLLCL